MRKIIFYTAAIMVLYLLTPCTYAGDIDPPTAAFDGGGNPQASMKTMNEVEPRRAIDSLPYIITNAGSYYLIQNMKTVSNIVGIQVECGDVQIDLNGFALIGSTNSADGIRVIGTNENITIQNGSIRSWGGFGINAPGADDGSVEKIKAGRNGLGGILYGNGAMISLCIAFGNGYKAPLPPAYIEPTITDQDFDGLEDSFEQMIIDANTNDAIMFLADVMPTMDFDMDGASNMDEFMAGTDPTLNELPDADYDNMDDEWENTMIADDNPGDSISNFWDVMADQDYDMDGAMNIDEFNSGTDPANSSSVDADYDGMNDDFEWPIVNDNLMDFIYNIWDVQAHHDYDGDLASNWDEYQADPQTDPTDPNDTPVISGTQSEYAMYTNPPSGPLFEAFDDPTDEKRDDGIRTGGYSTVKECQARGNRGSGIYVQYGSRVLNCIGAGNLVDGIHLTDYCSVLDCTAARNLKDGITVASKCRVKDNNCGQNGDYNMTDQAMPRGAGIKVMGNGNRIEDNNVCGNALGIEVDDAFSYQYGTAGMSGGRNLIIGNSSVDNWGKAFDLSSGDFMGGTMYQTDINDAANTNNNAMMDANNPFSNFNY